MKTFKTLREARAELKKRGHYTDAEIRDRRLARWRTKAQRARITRPYYVATHIEHLNFE